VILFRVKNDQKNKKSPLQRGYSESKFMKSVVEHNSSFCYSQRYSKIFAFSNAFYKNRKPMFKFVIEFKFSL